jgi:hypothetical protein
MDSVSIDFVAGSHGNFLEYVCNKFIARQEINFSPFNHLGASHNKENTYIEERIFKCGHYSEYKIPTDQKIIKIDFDDEDLLTLSSVCFLRAGDSNIDITSLEKNTYNKLIHGHFKNLIAQINNSYPDVQLSEFSPNCPRHILREFFKFGFKTPSINGFTILKKNFVYNKNFDIFIFKFINFYDTDKFIKNLKDLAVWYGMGIDQLSNLKLLHKEFLDKQIIKNHKSQCDVLVNCVKKRQNVSISNLTVLQESYINGALENIYQIEMPFNQEKYFNSTQEIVQYLDV